MKKILLFFIALLFSYCLAAQQYPKIGIASYYANKFIGRKTANGEIYKHNKFTAASNTLPFGTWVRVENLKNNRFVFVRINDRMHPKNKRLIDLSRIAAKQLQYDGLTRVKVEVLSDEDIQAILTTSKFLIFCNWLSI